MRLLRTQTDEVVDELLVVVLVAVVATVQVGRIDAVAQLPVGGVGQEGNHARLVEREERHLSLSAGASLFAGRLQHIVRKASLLLGREGHLEAVVLGQEVVAEAYRGKGQFAVDLLQAGLLLPVQQGSGPHEAPVGLLQQPLLLGVERKGPAPLVEVADPRKEPLVEQNPVVMGRQARHELLLQGLQLGVVLRGAEHAEDQFGLRQHRSGAVVGQDDVFERGIVVVRRNGVDLGVMQRHAPLESRQEVFGADLIEGRYAVGRRPLREEGVLPALLLGLARYTVHHQKKCQ